MMAGRPGQTTQGGLASPRPHHAEGPGSQTPSPTRQPHAARSAWGCGKSAAGALSQQEEAGGAAAESDEPTSLVMVGAGVGGLVGVVALSMLVHKGYQSCTGETSYGSIIDDADDDFVEGYEEKQPIIETFTNSMSRDQQSADADAPSVAERSI